MTNPVALVTTVWGNGSKRALLLHGLTSAGSTWWRIAADLVELGFTVVAPDLRAHGASPAGDNLSIEAYRDDVLLLGNGWDVIIGHSLGGAVAAAVLGAAPGFAKKVVFEDPAIDSDVTARLLKDSPEPLGHPTVAAIAAEHPNWHPRDVELKVEALLACGPEVSDRTMADGAPWDVWPDVLSLQIPGLIIAPDPSEGALVSARNGTEARAANQHLQFVLLDGAGHSMHRDAYDRFSPLIRDFVVG